jgi:phosphatidate cytidylyltransferase
MSDDMWRRRDGRGEDSEASEFGGPLFPDDPADDQAGGRGDDVDDGPIDELGDDTGGRRLSFGPDDTGPLPHWTAPPTGEIPRLAPSTPESGLDDEDDNDDVDVWSTFTTESPVWRDDDPATVTGVMEQIPSEFGPGSGPDPSGGYDSSLSGGMDRPAGQVPRADDSDGFGADDFGTYRHEPSGEISTGLVRPYGRSAQRGAEASGSVPIPRREPGRIQIGTDPSGMPRRSPDPGRRRSGPPPRGGRPAGPPRGVSAQTPRNMQSAVVAGAVLAAGFIAALMIHELIVLGIIVVVLAIAGYEYFGKVTEKGYRPAVVAGLVACAVAPIAAYNMGERALPLVVVLGFLVGAVGFMGAHGIEAGPLPNMAITTLGVVWIAVLGSFAALILRLNTGGVLINGTYVFAGGSNMGTDTLLLVALGVAANDIGALVVGSAVGKTPLRTWISPSKTIEGLLGGALATVVALFIASKLMDDLSIWTDTSDALILALVIAITAPLGDLTESMFKRNLDVKDFGSIVQGHGGVLDRFDGFLFALPAAYYATLYLVTN